MILRFNTKVLYVAAVRACIVPHCSFIYVFFLMYCVVMLKKQLQNRHKKCSIGFSVRAGSISCV